LICNGTGWKVAPSPKKVFDDDDLEILGNKYSSAKLALRELITERIRSNVCVTNC